MTLDERVSTTIEATGSQDRSWRFWFTVPIYPYSQRRTIRTEILPNTIWTFEQLQGIFYVVVPIRMTVVKLSGGGLLVYAPVAPTEECIDLVNELVAIHGDVKYIILPTISGLEHKAFVGPFARKFPQAQVWVAPDQWSFPINLPLSWLGFPSDRTYILPADSSQTPFGDEFDYAILGTLLISSTLANYSGRGQFAEVAFLHRRSRTLLVTDTIVSLPSAPPQMLELEPYPLLFHARDRASDPIVDTPANRLKGWQRICLFALYFQPSVLKTRNWFQTFGDAVTAPERSRESYFGIYPFDWKPNWEQTFLDTRDNGRAFVAPILQTLILNRAPQQTIAWVDRIVQWDFDRIIPCHFDAPVIATPEAFRAAFSFLECRSTPAELPATDMQLLRKIDRQLVWLRLIVAAKDKI
ncbi:DUF4336 domain-containing protein [Chamaesiphon polymorphus]|uniref:DUF4336 domain-containing protein n=1 Tax=Chamaesiphon polymorphus CCALA 037 TaxID=2107692 RepID=A0A2T1GKA0_9CYAN|nr:DUF4336 domain-containing protein [Chamaesiphon polymorphus]PSB58259.1 hypothetical protein C7B77_05490 [Chamaesiphon polymorphus CCALA 037]